MEAINLTGTVNAHNQIQLDGSLPFEASSRVIVSVKLLDETNNAEVISQVEIAERLINEREEVFRELAK